MPRYPTGLRVALATALAALLLPAVLAPVRAATPAFAQALAEAAEPAALEAYRARAYAPLWTGPDQAERRAALLAALADAPAHGLPAARHDPEALRLRFAALHAEPDRARAEAAATAAFLRLARDLHGGVLDPRAVDDRIRRSRPRPDTEALLTRLEAVGPTGALREVLPTNPQYAALLLAREALSEARAAGGWGPPVPGPRLRPGDSGPAVAALRDRLIAMGFLARSDDPTQATADADGRMQTGADHYDATLVAAVQAAQIAHGLNPDGYAGPHTLAALNTPLDTRLAALTVALERERWMNRPRGDRHIHINLADASTVLIEDGRTVFATRSIIGDPRRETQTVEFSEAMTYLEINPDWTVPRGMLGRSYLPRLQADPYAFPQFQLIDSAGRIVPREAVDFTAHSARTLPVKLRQPPGPANPLGAVKFMFPNPYAIYLHDTPDRALFARDVRALSNGCIRLQDPQGLAHRLLAPQSGDPVAQFDRIHRSGRQTRIFLDSPVPVHIDYRTAFVDEDGRPAFRADIYGRDARIAEALARAGVQLLPPEG
ncbi:MAG: L,D-transpeptidase family protein [Alkalilacustris sp.]